MAHRTSLHLCVLLVASLALAGEFWAGSAPFATQPGLAANAGSGAELPTSIDIDDDAEGSSEVRLPAAASGSEAESPVSDGGPGDEVSAPDLDESSTQADEDSGALTPPLSQVSLSPIDALKSLFLLGDAEETGAIGSESGSASAKTSAVNHVNRLLQMLRESSDDEEERLFLVDRREKKFVTVKEWYASTVAATMLGRRPTDEDAILVTAPSATLPDVRMKAIFDGHAGEATSQYCARHIASHLGQLSELSAEEITRVCLELDAEIIQSSGSTHVAGSTGIIVLIERVNTPRVEKVVGRELVPQGEEGDFVPLEKLIQEEDDADHPELAGRYPKVPEMKDVTIPGGSFIVTVANIGDSRAMLIDSDGGFTRLSKDHKPNHPIETARIEKAGGFVQDFDVPRVDGILALSRAFGDSDFKLNLNLSAEEQKVIAVPEVRKFYAKPGDLLLLACDGLFEPNGMDWLYVRDLTLTELEKANGRLEDVVARLMDYAYDMGSQDNISVMITSFHKRKVEQPTAVHKVVSGAGEVVSERHRPGDDDEAVEGDMVSLF
ncbi:putative protein phosphatase 2C [Neospora caninum Liverpool]|uniref:protein-serine/threonine phosphatase n=1 Tax=Neospora caninum (strain Liverpool) TaxID=572307 RepID=F0VJE1_NEOCL|nr:putative protein phosphatase 2C [Neospora caninum Liverpool]CBZ53852.1 putative protein phosphatase 2C [Neospora caninum Liverpool]CEL67847.1 TPA: protein phosphatase 2C, putative [Neospora caninum Liverpool]|eukprot:XP_003883884.1 putative protein phosphatase 2C [Neospora caninum Liverpool]